MRISTPKTRSGEFHLAMTIMVAAALATSASNAEPTTHVAHPFHNSIAEMEWNKEAQAFEIALSLWPVDLEKVLGASKEIRSKIKKTINVDDPDQHEILNSGIQQYVNAKLQAEIDSMPFEMKWLGFEVEKETVWCYFEWKLPQEAQKDLNLETKKLEIFISNQLFFELQDDQQNTILFRHAGKRRGIHFVRNHPRQKLDWDASLTSKSHP